MNFVMVPAFSFPNGTRANEVKTPTGAKLLYRGDGRIEAICEHGVGHCIAVLGPWQEWMGIHGCDGCCAKWELK